MSEQKYYLVRRVIKMAVLAEAEEVELVKTTPKGWKVNHPQFYRYEHQVLSDTYLPAFR